jgi:hypothetical protein
MKIVAAILIALGVTTAAVVVERPVVNIPAPERQQNWTQYREGSCTFATMVSLLRWQGQYELAERVRRHGGGASAVSLAHVLDREGIRYAEEVNGDPRFLEWSIRTRRGCGIAVEQGDHFVALVHLDAEWAAILDNNDISGFYWIPRAKLIAEWRAAGGWAFSPAYNPPAPLPR